MARRFNPGLLVTVGALATGALACGGSGPDADTEIHRNPPALPPHVKATFPSPPFSEGQSLQPRDEQGREIYQGSAGCWVELPIEGPVTSWRPPPTQAVECPEPLAKDPAYTACDGGSVHLRTLPDACVCYFSGNPPPSPIDVPCPATAIPALEPIHRNPPALPPSTIPEAGGSRPG